VVWIESDLPDEKSSDLLTDCDDPVAELGKHREAPFAPGIHEREVFVFDVDEPSARQLAAAAA
jgi:hypothetical protein